MSTITRHQHLLTTGEGNSPGKFYDAFVIDGVSYGCYGRIDTSGKAITIPDFDKVVKSKLAKGYRGQELTEAEILARGWAVATAFGLSKVELGPEFAAGRTTTGEAGSERPARPLIETALASPMDTDDLDAFAEDDNWYMEQKLDGHRLRIVNEDGTMRFLNRVGDDYSKAVPDHVRSLDLPVGWAVDGELVGTDYWAFDILHSEQGVHAAPLDERRLLLETLAKSITGLNVIPQARTTEQKRALMKFALVNNLEGVVLKKRGSTYPRGRGYNWLKAKFTPTADVVVMAVGDDGKESARLGIYGASAPDLTLKEIGRCSLIGKPPVTVGDIVEVKYLYLTDSDNPRLYQPTLMRVRFDKEQSECRGDDFRVVNKSVLDALPV